MLLCSHIKRYDGEIYVGTKKFVGPDIDLKTQCFIVVSVLKKMNNVTMLMTDKGYMTLNISSDFRVIPP